MLQYKALIASFITCLCTSFLKLKVQVFAYQIWLQPLVHFSDSVRSKSKLLQWRLWILDGFMSYTEKLKSGAALDQRTRKGSIAYYTGDCLFFLKFHEFDLWTNYNSNFMVFPAQPRTVLSTKWSPETAKQNAKCLPREWIWASYVCNHQRSHPSTNI